jgi:hypothetical protein
MTQLAANYVRERKLGELNLNVAPADAGKKFYVGAFICREAATAVVIPGTDAAGLVPLGVVLRQPYPDDPDASLTSALDNTSGADGVLTSGPSATRDRLVQYAQDGEWAFKVGSGTPKVGGIAYLVDDNTVQVAATTNGIIAGRFTRPSFRDADHWFVDIGKAGVAGGGAQGAAITSLTDSSGGTANNTLEAIASSVTGVDGTGSNAASKANVDTALVAIKNNFADLAAKNEEILDALRAAGIIAT